MSEEKDNYVTRVNLFWSKGTIIHVFLRVANKSPLEKISSDLSFDRENWISRDNIFRAQALAIGLGQFFELFKSLTVLFYNLNFFLRSYIQLESGKSIFSYVHSILLYKLSIQLFKLNVLLKAVELDKYEC